MSGLNATIILRKHVSDEQLSNVSTILRDIASEFKHSRKGHNWDFTVTNGDSPPHSYSLQLVATEKHRYDYEDELLERDLDFDSAPVAFEIVAYCSNESDHIVCEALANKLTEMFGGINLGVRC